MGADTADVGHYQCHARTLYNSFVGLLAPVVSSESTTVIVTSKGGTRKGLREGERGGEGGSEERRREGERWRQEKYNRNAERVREGEGK